MGIRLCFYRWTHDQRLTPSRIASDERMLDEALKDRWDCDILQEDGAQRFQPVVNEIKQLGLCDTIKYVVPGRHSIFLSVRRTM